MAATDCKANHATGIRLAVAMIGLAAGFTALGQPLTQEIRLRPEPLVQLAQSIKPTDPLAYWDLADTLLAVMIETYQDELRRSQDDDITRPSRKSKLARWQIATEVVLADLIRNRLRLSEGSAFTIQVDATGQILLFIDQQPIAFAVPRPGTEQAIAEQVVKRFCARNTCSVLEEPTAGPKPAAHPGSGNWLIRRHARPVYEIANQLQCEFDDLSNRARKAVACRDALADIQRLGDALAEAQRQGHTIDWVYLRGNIPQHGFENVLKINPEGRYLRLSLPVVSRLSADSWDTLIRTLRDSLTDGEILPRIIRAEQLPVGGGR
jgi:hypothetical protein